MGSRLDILVSDIQTIRLFSLVIVLTAFEISVYYWFIKKYIPKEWYWFAVFIYVFNPNFMLTQSSMMRQTLAMCIVLLSIPYIYKKRSSLQRYLFYLPHCFTVAPKYCYR